LSTLSPSFFHVSALSLLTYPNRERFGSTPAILDPIPQHAITPKTARRINSGRSNITSHDLRQVGQASAQRSSSIPTVHPIQRFFQSGTTPQPTPCHNRKCMLALLRIRTIRHELELPVRLLMILEALRRHGTQTDLVMMYPRELIVPVNNHPAAVYESSLLAQARDAYYTKLVPIQVKAFINNEDSRWQDSYTKMLAWNQKQYRRVISLDSDATVLNVQTLLLKPRSRSFAIDD
jgi:hypothetical protein